MLPEKENPAPVAGSRETVLLVDDESSMLFVTRRVLERNGFVVLPAGSGPAALEIWQTAKEEIQLVLTDLKMPGMTGRELVEILLAERANLKILFMSGSFEREPVGSIKLLEGVNLIRKPFTAAKLAEAVRNLLDRRE